MTTDKIQFTKEKETMLITLNGRAVQSAWKNPILRDPWAEEAMRHIDYDMSKTLKGVPSSPRAPQPLIYSRTAILLITRMRPCSTWAAAWTAVFSESIRPPVSSGSMWITPM
jgi:O-methyltransferase involved in polyketide biosynthesis